MMKLEYYIYCLAVRKPYDSLIVYVAPKKNSYFLISLFEPVKLGALQSFSTLKAFPGKQCSANYTPSFSPSTK